MSDRGQSFIFSPAMEAVARVEVLRKELGTRPLEAVVIGAGKSGLSAMELLAGKGAKVTVVDDRTGGLPPDAHQRLARAGATFGGPLTAASLEGAELVVLSPGVPRVRPELAAAIDRGVLVGEIELASWFVRAPIVGITGTNGKSTTTALVAHLFRTAEWATFAGGNLGRPLADLVVAKETPAVAVVELSSYQLESIVDARFAVACWLNLTPDHADRYPDIETYARAKRRILEARAVNGLAVLNARDPRCLEAGLRLGGPIRWFAADETFARVELAETMGTYLTEPDVAVRTDGGVRERYDLANPNLPGMHNRANMCAAIECARALDVPVEAVQEGLLSFEGLPHRIQLVAFARGARWYNDSKATNVDSALTALRAVSGPKILIAGGRDKGAPWAPLREQAASVKAVLAIGEATPLVIECFRGHVPVVEDVKDLARAVERAAELAGPGDSVLLAPACASFDQFKNYEERGATFARLVQALSEGEKK